MTDNGIEYRVKVLERQIDKINESCKDINDRLICVEKIQESIGNTLNDFTKHTEAIVKMTYEVKNLSNNFSKAIIEIKEQEDRISKIENKPGTLAIKAWMFVLTNVGASILGVIIGTYIK